ncbi:hypothetical protein BJ508DRAFT_342508 [Ascobolus immersus RN42]|uniref:Uncharacterized protein n=1 Tax=Ascobolus immersus RN42 TaxID=1160509 RepID=A0A3N4IQX0_ASCIM|nr:hypothetical protein BJ508DRAFT_342508 [Ascobolus immersus RN42]
MLRCPGAAPEELGGSEACAKKRLGVEVEAWRDLGGSRVCRVESIIEIDLKHAAHAEAVHIIHSFGGPNVGTEAKARKWKGQPPHLRIAKVAGNLLDLKQPLIRVMKAQMKTLRDRVIDLSNSERLFRVGLRVDGLLSSCLRKLQHDDGSTSNDTWKPAITSAFPGDFHAGTRKSFEATILLTGKLKENYCPSLCFLRCRPKGCKAERVTREISNSPGPDYEEHSFDPLCTSQSVQISHKRSSTEQCFHRKLYTKPLSQTFCCFCNRTKETLDSNLSMQAIDAGQAQVVQRIRPADNHYACCQAHFAFALSTSLVKPSTLPNFFLTPPTSRCKLQGSR